MIIPLPSFDLARLVNGKLVAGQHTHGSLIPSWSETKLAGDCAVRVCTGSNIGYCIEKIAVLLDDSKILIGYSPISSRLEDITPTVRDLFGADAANIQGISVKERSVIVWSYSAVGVFHLGLNSVYESVYYRQFPAEIDLISINEYYCLIKTRDNCLFEITHVAMLDASQPIEKKEGSMPSRMCVFNDRPELTFHDVKSITKIHTSASWVLLLMENGSVYGREYNGPFFTDKLFTQVQIPEYETVTKIVNAYTHVIYITAAGNCYSQDTYGMSDLSSVPVLVKELQGHVEDATAICSGSILAQCSNSSSLKTYCVRFYTLGGSAVRSLHLPTLDGMTVNAITHQAMRTCFVTDEDSVFWSYNILDAEPIITRDPFFDSNLLATGSNAARIRSAGSVLDDTR